MKNPFDNTGRYKDILKSFTTSLQAEGKSANTISGYVITARQLLRAHKNDPGQITQESLDTFFSRFNARNQTQNIKKAAVNAFLAYLYARKRLNRQFIIKSHNITLPEPEYLSKGEQDRFFEALQADPARIRDYTLFAVMLYTGLRVSEVVNIRLKDIQDDQLVIRDSKTGPGKGYLRKKLTALLDVYLDSLKSPLGREDNIFQSKQRRRLSVRMVQLLIKKYLRLAGIRKDLAPHSLRHTFAANLMKSSGNLGIVQRSLRHKHIQSTMRYAHIEEEDLKNAVERSVKIPVRKKKPSVIN
jgi:site-specific recombinase XerD